MREEQSGVSQWPEVLACAFRTAKSVQACAAAPACGCRPMFPLRGNIGVVGRISGFFRESLVQRSGKPSLDANSRFLPLRRAAAGNGQLSPNAWRSLRLQRTVDSRSSGGLSFAAGKTLLNARADLCLQRKNASQRSGAPGRFLAARPTAASSRNLFPALNAAAVVQVSCP